MLVALDLNADRLLAVRGNAADAGQIAMLAEGRRELPLALSLANRQIVVGRAGRALQRKAPHLACTGFLPCLGTATTWKHGRKRLDGGHALVIALRHARDKLGAAKGVCLTLPGYLSRAQVTAAVAAAKQAGFPITGVLTRTLASALQSHAEHPWHNVALLLDVDEHALTIAVLRAGDADMNALGQRTFPALGMKAWRDRLLAAVADLCVRTSRRDPRTCPEADQMVFDQLDDLLDACGQGRPVALRINGIQWFQTLTVQPSLAVAACAPLARQAAAALQAALRWAEQQLTTVSIYFTDSAARLPGLAGAVYAACENRVPVAVLSPDAAALAAFDLAQRIDRRELPQGLFEPTAPLPVVDRGEVPDMIPFPAHLRQAAPERP